MQRYFIDSKQILNNIVTITNSDVHHIKNVMRMKVNDEVIVCDNLANTYLSKLISIEKDKVLLEIIDKINENNELPIDITIAHGVVRREKTEEVIRRITELGCYEYLPVLMKRSVVKVYQDRSERQNKIIKEASEQSHRNRLMILSSVISFQELINRKDEFDLCLYAHFNKNVKSIKKIIENFHGRKILVAVGPEGGFADEEVLKLDEAGFIPITLGKRVLRTETAPLYVISVFGYEFESFID
ncbi:MAG TPA: 16S rRNA (uracil(1498)-N(3))-methyltransferase [Acholeplasmataceae bacterium]|nr:16S rRNA (uracil(1498)-N(3))-methyltransferase [Acholeplasmataceae bacterium]